MLPIVTFLARLRHLRLSHPEPELFPGPEAGLRLTEILSSWVSILDWATVPVMLSEKVVPNIT